MAYDYVSLTVFDVYARDKQGSSSDQAQRQSALLAAHQAVDAYIGRSCAVASTATERLYVPNGGTILRIHDCTTITSVTLDGATIASTSRQSEPYNVAPNGRARPYEQIRLLSGYWVSATPFKASVAVTATWGWAAVPDEVIEATKILAADILQQRQTVGGMAAAGDFGGFVRRNPYVRLLLDPLRRGEIVAAMG